MRSNYFTYYNTDAKAEEIKKESDREVMRPTNIGIANSYDAIALAIFSILSK